MYIVLLARKKNLLLAIAGVAGMICLTSIGYMGASEVIFSVVIMSGILCFLRANKQSRIQARLLQVRIDQSQKLETISKFAGGIAHDFNNILSVVDGYSKIIQRGLVSGADVFPHFEIIDRTVKRGTQLTGGLLDLRQCRVVQKIRLDICKQIRGLEYFLEPVMPASINLTFNIQQDACYVDAAPEILMQIIINLVDNACEAMPEGGNLVISVTQDPLLQSYVVIKITDSGTGIDSKILKRVFEPFFTTRGPAKHSGLGLSLVRDLAAEIDAAIDIASAVDTGTSVSILIPVQETLINLKVCNLNHEEEFI